MNREDILYLHEYFSDKELDEVGTKLKEKIGLIKEQIVAQDMIQAIQKKLAEMDKIKD